MDFHRQLSRLTQSVDFKEWHDNNTDFFLAHAFLMLDEANKDTWQFGFYSPIKDLMVSFFVSTTISHSDEQKVLKKDEVAKLDPSFVKIEVRKALEIANDVFNNYKENALKSFFIIQNIDNKTIFNFTFFTQSFNTVNIRIDAETGEVIHESKKKLMDQM